MKKTWWKESVVYQIYPRSFKDTTGNGIGDIHGIIEKLDHIKSLGVDVIWLCPVYESPNDDNGYDISHYRKISDDFGGQEAFDELLEKTHQKGLKLVMDLVANHTSDEHYWFTESKKSKSNPYRDYYIWKDGQNDGPPNNWESFFNGSTWEYDSTTDQYYLHYFTKKQPDLNWENPKVRKEIFDVVEYWFKKGVDGFRMDVISLISKPDGYPNSEHEKFQETIINYYANGPKIHQYLHEMNQEVLSKYDIMTVGEGPGIDLANGPLYVDASREELNMVFHFDHMFIDCGVGGKYDPIPIDFKTFKTVFNNWDKALKNKGWGSIFLGSHDFSRMVSRFGNDQEYRKPSAKLLATLLLTLRGTVYVYQGDEIGMTNVAYDSIEDYNDVETLNAWKAAEEEGQDMEEFLHIVHIQSRDNARTPMQWSSDANAGFTEGIPWLKTNPNHKNINVATQENDPNSILNYYRDMIAFRKANKTFVYGDYECLDLDNPSIYAYRRWDKANEFLVLHNFSDKKIHWGYDLNEDNYKVLKSNMAQGQQANFELEAWQTKILKRI
ncbi:glycoside hydrolase family 13 protein [Croceitalea rosinachiae]|uniref:Alpha-glucosidase n=1 Tax=Croceitalea rosinachiae TaxID=3075596 RepID=A0ABU3A9Q5_9FLAO|nr:alpha-glucosidase [Croceitalea sp. F388]MDT0606618.1 alpha-glucosidase [Croceitalea sp. F388]